MESVAKERTIRGAACLTLRTALKYNNWMSVIRPFRALRPTRDHAAEVSSVPYDVVNTEEARQLAANNPLSFLHVTRAEIDLGADADP